MILVTGQGVRASVVALKKSAMRWQTSHHAPGHPDCLSGASQPERQRPVNRILGHVKNVILIDPQEYYRLSG